MRISKKTLLIILAIFVVIFGVFAVVKKSKQGESTNTLTTEQQIEAFLVLIQKNKANESYEYLAGSTKSVTTLDTWTKSVNNMSKLLSGGAFKKIKEDPLPHNEKIKLYTYQLGADNDKHKIYVSVDISSSPIEIITVRLSGGISQ